MGDMEILLAAPTGRAAKRMTEATGYEARDNPPPSGAERNAGTEMKRTRTQECILSVTRKIRWRQM